MPKRANPVKIMKERMMQAAAHVDSVAMSRMPERFQKMHRQIKARNTKKEKAARNAG